MEGRNIPMRSGRATSLKLLQLIGLVPLASEPPPSRLARGLFLFKRFILIALDIGAIATLTLDACLPPAQSMRMKEMPGAIVWMLETMLLLLENVCAMWTAASRMDNWFGVMERIEMDAQKLNDHIYSEAADRRDQIFVLSMVVFPILLYTFNFSCGFNIAMEYNTPMHLYIMYITTFLAFMIVIIVEVHLVLTYHYFHSLLRIFNQYLENMILVNSRGAESELEGQERVEGNNDTEGLVSEQSRLTTRQLISVYIEVYELMQSMNDGSNGLLVILILLDIVVYLIVVPYMFINNFLLELALTPNIIVAFEGTWCLFHVLNIYLMVLPGHLINEQTHRMQLLVSKLLLTASTECKPEMEHLSLTLLVIKPSLCPLGICTFSRRFVISIFSFVSTFIMTLEQFRDR